MRKVKKRSQLVHDLIILIVGTLIGGLVTHHYQLALLREQYREELSAKETSSADRLCKNLNISMDTRMYAMRAILIAYKQNRPLDYRRKRWAEYETVLKQWNTNLNSNSWEIARYFGPKHSKDFEEEIHGRFKDIGSQLEDIAWKRAQPTSKRLAAIERQINDLTSDYKDFNNTLLAEIDEGNVGRCRKK